MSNLTRAQLLEILATCDYDFAHEKLITSNEEFANRDVFVALAYEISVHATDTADAVAMTKRVMDLAARVVQFNVCQSDHTHSWEIYSAINELEVA